MVCVKVLHLNINNSAYYVIKIASHFSCEGQEKN